MNKYGSSSFEDASGSDLVVVHTADGVLIKGALESITPAEPASPSSAVPEALHLRCTTGADACVVPLPQTKAVFIVKRHEGNPEQDEVRFFSDMDANDVWVRIRFADGEILEGQTGNGKHLLSDPGIWLRPFDTTGNNLLVYVPKSSIVVFHIMGVAIPRQGKGENHAEPIEAM